MEKRDLIAAVATGAGNAAVGVVRLSGSGLTGLIPGLLGVAIEPRTATLCDFLDEEGRTLDRGLALYFPEPHSYTGEDVLELQGHGGAAVLDLVLRRCLALGARLANPGEFTLRAFLNGKLDLAQAEAVADLIGARTERAALSAARSLKGEFSLEVNRLIEQLTQVRAQVEASIDFPEEDLGPDFSDRIDRELAAVGQRMNSVRAAAGRGSILREGATVVLYGPPNVGKSSLMNRLAGSEVSIVTDVPGTTRDSIRELTVIRGVPVLFIDTAGVRETTDDVVERIGIERTRTAVQSANLTLFVFDATEGRGSLVSPVGGAPCLHVANKCDLCEDVPESSEDVIYVSAKTGEGLETLRDRVLVRLGWAGEEELVYAARARHLDALGRSARHLAVAAGLTGRAELVAEELRQAQAALREVGGDICSDDLLGEIFSKFCIGK